MLWRKIHDPDNVQVVDEQGIRHPAKEEEVANLEPYAVWSPIHVEKRLLDTFEGQPTKRHWKRGPKD
jgi:hypothetical protein